MKRLGIYLFAISIFAITNQSIAQDSLNQNETGVFQPKLPIVAVMPFQARLVDSREVETLTEALMNELQNTGKVRVMERAQMDRILAEQGFQRSGACESGECAVEVGKLLGIDRMVVGSVGKLGDATMMNVRLVNVETGEVMKSSSRKDRGSLDQIADLVIPQIASDILGKTLPPTEPELAIPVAPALPTILPEQPAITIPAAISTPNETAAVANVAASLPPPVSTPAPVPEVASSRTWIWWAVGGGILVVGGATAFLVASQSSSGSSTSTPPIPAVTHTDVKVVMP